MAVTPWCGTGTSAARGWGHSPEVSFDSVREEQSCPSQGSGEEGDASTEAPRQAPGGSHPSLPADKSTDCGRSRSRVGATMEQQQGQEAAALPNSHRGAAGSCPLLETEGRQRLPGPETKHEHVRQSTGLVGGMPRLSPDRFQQFIHTGGTPTRALAHRGLRRLSRPEEALAPLPPRKGEEVASSSGRGDSAEAGDVPSGAPAGLVRGRSLAGSSGGWAVPGGDDKWRHVVQARGPTGEQVPVVLALSAVPSVDAPGRRVVQKKLRAGSGKNREQRYTAQCLKATAGARIGEGAATRFS